MRQMITILGPTASGKTRLAAALAAKIGAEIISADSRQVYRRMDIGTGKDLADYVVNDTPVPYHLVDICEPGTRYNLFQYQKDFIEAYDDIRKRGRRVVLCGGTGLYIEAVLKGYQLSPVPQNDELRERLAGKDLDELAAILADLKRRNHSNMHNRTDVDSPQRAIRAIEIEEYNMKTPVALRYVPPVPSLVVGVDISREERRARITQRLNDRLEGGMVDEVRQLIADGVEPENLIYYGLEYKFVTEYVIGKISYQEMFTQLEIAIHQFAKRQMTWFRGMERRGVTIHWIDAMLPLDEKVQAVIALDQQQCGLAQDASNCDC